MKEIPIKEENDYGCPLDFEPDKMKKTDEQKLLVLSKKLSIDTLKSKGYIDDAFNIMLELNKENDNYEKI